MPFIFKIGLLFYNLYKHYFIRAINSSYPFHFEHLSFLFGHKEREEREERKPIGFDTTFTDEDKAKAQARENARLKANKKR